MTQRPGDAVFLSRFGIKWISPFKQIVSKVADERLAHGLLHIPRRNADVMPVSAVADFAQLALQSRDFRDSRATEELGRNDIVGESSLADEKLESAIIGDRTRSTPFWPPLSNTPEKNRGFRKTARTSSYLLARPPFFVSLVRMATT